jgi:hypothetical protein
MKNLKKLSRENLRTIKGGAWCLGCGCATNGATNFFNGACVVCENNVVVLCPIQPCELCEL